MTNDDQVDSVGGDDFEPAKPTDVVDAVASASSGDWVVLDFDETLILRNSTEEYLDSLRPRTMARLLLFLLGVIRPWRLWPAAEQRHVREWIRVLVPTVVMPWSVIRWKAHAKRISGDLVNHDLIGALEVSDSPNIVVATHGFSFIVGPLLSTIPVDSGPLVSRRFWRGARDGLSGKAGRVSDAIGQTGLERSIVVTDSLRDLDLLEAAAESYLTQWPDSEYRRALHNVYVPLAYVERIKRPGRQFVLKTVIGDDWALLVLAIAWTLGSPLIGAVGLLLFTLAFWTIYEVGYRENDRIGAEMEAEPTLAEEFFSERSDPTPVVPWLWAVAFAVLGSVALGYPAFEFAEIAGRALRWSGVLVALRLVYWVYNRANKDTRAWLYLALHVLRSLGILVVFPGSVVGVIALSAQALSRWSMYLIYRIGRAPWPGPDVSQLVQLLIFLVIGGAVTAPVPDAVMTWQFLAVAGWFVMRARRGLVRAVEHSGPVE